MEARLHLHYDICPKWLELSLRHLIDAQEQRDIVLTAWKAQDREAATAALDLDFQAGAKEFNTGSIQWWSDGAIV